VDVPDFQKESALGGITIGFADGARVPIAPRRQTPAQRGARMAVVERPPVPFPPSLDRVFSASDTLHVYLEGTARAAGARTMVSVDVVDANGKTVRSPSPSFMTTDIVRIESLIPLSGLPPGPYVLRATMTNGSRPPAVRESGFVVR
jgi:hypothetical protein